MMIKSGIDFACHFLFNFVNSISENMKNSELKKQLHQIIDTIDNEALLKTLYNLLKHKTPINDGHLWQLLSEEQKDEVLLAFEESQNTDELIGHEDVMKQYKKWL